VSPLRSRYRSGTTLKGSSLFWSDVPAHGVTSDRVSYVTRSRRDRLAAPVIIAWIKGHPSSHRTLHTDGVTLFSRYPKIHRDVPIARQTRGKLYVISALPHTEVASVTRHARLVHHFLADNGIPYEVDSHLSTE